MVLRVVVILALDMGEPEVQAGLSSSEEPEFNHHRVLCCILCSKPEIDVVFCFVLLFLLVKDTEKRKRKRHTSVFPIVSKFTKTLRIKK
ncbi:unnamed protein product [Lactuca virosa]|uniref:Uncharacterized protein n=1 Tax=Lactuca virosa TaxID=75947 RepID=A0AAU9P9U1_9ASTR|nr:unnamed protein product [Lactuca virosa]